MGKALTKHDIITLVKKNKDILKKYKISKIPPEFRNKHPGVPWTSLIGLRNILIHDYMDVDVNAVWENIRKELSPLKKQVQAVIDKEAK